MPRRKADGLDAAIAAYKALSADDKLVFARILRHLPGAIVPAVQERRRPLRKAVKDTEPGYFGVPGASDGRVAG